MTAKSHLLILALALCCTAATADTIHLNGTLLTDVIVREGAQRYYIQLPETGETITASKENVSPQQVIIENDTQRAILHEKWKLTRAATHPEQSPKESPMAQKEREIRERLSQPTEPNTRTFTNQPTRAITGTDKNGLTIQLNDIPLGEGLRAILRAENLDYTVYDNYLYVSTPDQLRYDSSHTLQTRTYQLRNLGAESLPKITLRQPGVITQQSAQFGGGGQGGFGGGQSGFGGGQGGGGQGGFGGGQGGGGQGGFGGGQGGGGQGGFGGGQGGFGGGQGGGGMQVGQLSLPNMIMRFPDALVGETPPQTAIVGINRNSGAFGAAAAGRP